MDNFNSDNQEDEPDCHISSGEERNASTDIDSSKAASCLNETSNESPKIVDMERKDIPLKSTENKQISKDDRSTTKNSGEFKPVPDDARKSEHMISTGLKTSSSSPELQNNLSSFPLKFVQQPEINNEKTKNKADLSTDEHSQEISDDPSISLMAPTDSDKNEERSPSGRRRIGTVNLPKLMIPSSLGAQDLPMQSERTHETIVEDPTSACFPENTLEPTIAESDSNNGSTIPATTPETAECEENSSERKISLTKRFVTTPVSDAGSNPFLNKMANSSSELESSPQSSPVIGDFSRPRTSSVSTPKNAKRVQKRSVDNSNLYFKPSTPQASRKNAKEDEYDTNSLCNTPNTSMTNNRLLDQVRRKNFSTNTNPYPPRRKESMDSMGSQQSLTRKFSEQNSRKGSNSPSWQKRLSQLFVPPSMEELNKRCEEESKLMSCDSGPPSAMQSRTGSRRGSKSADSVSKLFGKRRSKRRKSVNKMPQELDEQDRLEMLDKLEDTEGLSDGDSGNNDDDDSSSDYTDDETRGMVGRRSESFPLVKSEKLQPSIMRKEGQADASYDDTICSNRSSYFKHFYNLRPGKPQARSMQSRVMWHHTSIASLIREKEQPDELEERKKKKPPLDYPQLALSLFLFLVICVMVSLIFYFYKLHIMSVFIFNRIKIVEKTRNLEVLNINEDTSSITPVVIVRLGVDFPLNARHTDCTQYLKYLMDVRGDINKYRVSRKRRSIETQGNNSEIIGTDDLLTNLPPVLVKSKHVNNQTEKMKRRRNGKLRVTSTEMKNTDVTEMPLIDTVVIKPSGEVGSGHPLVSAKNKSGKRNGSRNNNSKEKSVVTMKSIVHANEMLTKTSSSDEDSTEDEHYSGERLATVITKQPSMFESVEEIEKENNIESSDEGLSNLVAITSNSGDVKANTDEVQTSVNSDNETLNNSENGFQIESVIPPKSTSALFHNASRSSNQISATEPNSNSLLEEETSTTTDSSNINSRRRFPTLLDMATSKESKSSIEMQTNLPPVLAKSKRVNNQTEKMTRRKNGKLRVTSTERKNTDPTEMPPIDTVVLKPSGKIRSGHPLVTAKNKSRKRNGSRNNNSKEKSGVAMKSMLHANELIITTTSSVEDTTEAEHSSGERLATIITEQPSMFVSVEEIEKENNIESSDDRLSNPVAITSNSGDVRANTDDVQTSVSPANQTLKNSESGVQNESMIPAKSTGALLHNTSRSSNKISATESSSNNLLGKKTSTTTDSSNIVGRRRFPQIRNSQTYHGLVDKIIHGESHNIDRFVDSRIEEPVESTVNPRFHLPRRRKIWKTPDVDPSLDAPEGNFDFVEPIAVEDFDSFDAAISDNVGIEDEFSEMQCIDYKGNGRLQLTQRPRIGEVDCFSVHWESSSSNVQMKDCFIMDNNATGAWWGLGDITGGSLPLSKLGKLEDTPLYSGEIQQHLLGGLIRRVWISSKGILVSVPLASKTVFSVNADKKHESEFCLASEKSIDVNHPNAKHNPVLDYTICTAPNVTSILSSLREVERMNEVEYQSSKWHRAQDHNDLRMLPPEAPPEITENLVEEVQERFNCPVWRPWLSHDEGDIDQDDVVAYAEEIAASSFDACGHVLLPVTWQNILGDLTFDQRRFPNPKLMIETLLRKGLHVALTLSPLIDTETPRFKNSSVTDLLIRQVNSTLPILVSTNRATVAGVLDFTNPNTIEWYASELKKLQENYGIDRFHVSPINTQSLPPFRQQYTQNQNPDYALGQFIKAVAQIRPPISTDVAIIPVNTPTFLLAGNGDASWEMLEMLPNRILSISSVGGTLVDSGVIGGWSNQKGHIPSGELYIRWMEVSIFFPAMQFSVLPGMYDAGMEAHAQFLQSIRKKFVIPRFNQNLPETLTHGYPLVFPLAIAFPKDPKCLKIGDQWMVGKDMMVAPVLRRGRRSRDIYVPPGIWKDGIDDRILKGKRWLKNYSVSIGKVPYFLLMIPERGSRGNKNKDGKQKRPRYH